MHTCLDEGVIMVVKEQLDKPLDIIDPKLYRKDSMIGKGKNLLYVRFQKWLYGLFHSNLLFDIKLLTYLKIRFLS